MLDPISVVPRVRPNGDFFLRTDDVSELGAVLRSAEAELRAGRRIWLCGEPFETLAVRMGRQYAGLRWLVLNPRAAGRLEWLPRLRDTVLSTLALVLLSPVFAVIAVLVKLSSPGPVFYTAEVVGKNGRQFTWFKFRSMRILAKEEDEQKRREQYRAFAERSQNGRPAIDDCKVIDGSRVTPVGRIIRKYSLDELPQLINVLRGQMAIVGPRPCLPYEAELFPQWARRRFDVRPGLTGVWQVHGRSRVGLEEALMMDVYYVYAHSLWLDLRLIAKTVAVVLNGQGGS